MKDIEGLGDKLVEVLSIEDAMEGISAFLQKLLFRLVSNNLRMDT